MAYASVASLIQTIDLVSYHHDDNSSISPRFNDQITSLHQHACFLQSFLEDGDPNRVRNWEETIRDVTDRAEEIIDILVSDSLLKSSKSEEVDGGMDDELEKVIKEMESTIERVKGRSTSPQAGLDEDLLDIIDRLTSDSCDLQTIAIVGKGGMGKSTLARNALDHPLVTEHFKVRAWYTVRQGDSERDILLDFLRFLDVESVSGDEAIERLHKNLWGRRYLIVLNDLWSVDVWHKVRRALPDNGIGSRIIFTTTFLELASLAGHVHEMRLLDEDGTWNMLREKIFKGDPCPSQLESTGKTIARSCGGHRLSIEVVSGILAADQTKAAWEDVLENIKIASEEDDFGFPQVLSLSYTYLPHHLRPCFLYLGCFPEDHEIRISKLILLWVAEGFLNESENKSFEEIGEEHVEELVRRSLFSVSERSRYNGRIKTITVHALMRDLCLREARKGNFFHDVGRFEMHESCRRVCSSNNCGDFVKDVYDSTIRTAILYNTEEGVRWSIENVRLLRILELSGAPDYELPEEVFELFHLRYLSFHSRFSISEAISNLQNLQTLVICSWERYLKTLVELPEGIWRMPQLRHLLGFGFILPTLKLEGEGEISALENLETLSGVVNFVCSKENLKMIPNVKKLALVFYTENSIDAVVHHVFHNLVSLHRLEILKIKDFCKKKHETGFAFPPTLKKLNLYGVELPWEDMKIVASLPNLEVLKLRFNACVGKTWKTSDGGFSRLTYLLIEISYLEHWITESSHFPRLKRLALLSCYRLSEVPREIGEIPTLELMELDRWNRALLDSAMQLREDRQSLGDDLLQVLVLGQR